MTAEQKRVAKEKRDREKNENPFETPKVPRQYTRSTVVTDPGVPCCHCQEPYGHKKQHKYPNGNQRYICGGCKKPFIVRKIG